MSINPLDETLEDLKNIKVVCDKEGNLTITGVSYRDMRSILTAAQLHRYDNPFKTVYVDPNCDFQEISKENAVESQNWNWAMSDLFKILYSRIVKAGNGSDDEKENSIAITRKMRAMPTIEQEAWSHDPKYKPTPRAKSTREEVLEVCRKATKAFEAELLKLIPEDEQF